MSPRDKSTVVDEGSWETSPMRHRVSSPTFVGRVDELELVRSVLERVATGQSATVLIAGEAGIGKTRLVEEICRWAQTCDVQVARGACVPVDGGGLPYGPVLGILGDLARLTDHPAMDHLLRQLGTSPALD